MKPQTEADAIVIYDPSLEELGEDEGCIYRLWLVTWKQQDVDLPRSGERG